MEKEKVEKKEEKKEKAEVKEEKAEMAEKKEEKDEDTKDEDPPPPAEEWWKFKFLLFSVLEREILQKGKVIALVCSPNFMPAMQQTATENLGHGCLCSEINFPCLERSIGFNLDFHSYWDTSEFAFVVC